MKVGDIVKINDEDWRVMNPVCSSSGEDSFIFTKLRKRSELEKFTETFCPQDRVSVREGALALLEYLENEIAKCRDLDGGHIVSVVRKWCGK